MRGELDFRWILRSWRSALALIAVGGFLAAYNACSVGGGTSDGSRNLASSAPFEYPVTLAGWIANDGGYKVALNRSLPAYSGCPDTVLNPLNPIYGARANFCFEPSGANGLFFNPNNNAAGFATIRNFVLGGSQTLTPLPRLMDLGTLQKNPVVGTATSCSDANNRLLETAFNYALAKLYVPPQASDDDLARFEFATTQPDDGLVFIVNGTVAGNSHIEEFRTGGVTLDKFSLHRGETNAQANLIRGWNQLIVILAEACKLDATFRALTGSAQLTYGFLSLTATVPHVVQGFVYDRGSGQPLANQNLKLISGLSSTFSIATTDARGFFEFAGVAPGPHELQATRADGTIAGSQLLNLPAFSADQWVHRFEVGL